MTEAETVVMAIVRTERAAKEAEEEGGNHNFVPQPTGKQSIMNLSCFPCSNNKNNKDETTIT